jgi:hypothetical protein
MKHDKNLIREGRDLAQRDFFVNFASFADKKRSAT